MKAFAQTFAHSFAQNASRLFARRVKGVRVIEIGGLAFLIVLVLGVYLFKGMAGAEGAQIADTTRQIAAEQQQVHALRADLARLEAPARLERLSTQYLGLAPVSAKHETAPDTLPGAPPVAVPSAPPPAPAAGAHP